MRERYNSPLDDLLSTIVDLFSLSSSFLFDSRLLNITLLHASLLLVYDLR